MIFQDFQLFPHLTALENVIEAPVHVFGVRRNAAARRGRQLLDCVGLGDRGIPVTGGPIPQPNSTP